MLAQYSFCNNPNPRTQRPVESESLHHRDQWVTTSHNGSEVVGRILAVLRHPEGETVYDVELPLQTGHGKMMRVVRFAGGLKAIECGVHADMNTDIGGVQ